MKPDFALQKSNPSNNSKKKRKQLFKSEPVIQPSKGFLPIFLKNPNISAEQEEILEALHKIQEDLEMAYQNFEYATDPQLIDSCIYELKALQLRYEYYLEQAREQDLIQELS